MELLYTICHLLSLILLSTPCFHYHQRDRFFYVNGVCANAAEDEFFRLTTKDGKLTVERGVTMTETSDFSPILQFEQNPVQILDALCPLYLKPGFEGIARITS